MNEDPVRTFLSADGDYRWEHVDVLRYKEEGAALFREVTRQTLFRRPDMRGELRYFEVARNGYSTLERHEHVHAVMILRGEGEALVDKTVFAVKAFDLVTVPPRTWHQFRAARAVPLGFLCMVDAERDKSQLPTASDLDDLRAHSAVAKFLAER